jgi:hypothetical protein
MLDTAPGSTPCETGSVFVPAIVVLPIPCFITTLLFWATKRGGVVPLVAGTLGHIPANLFEDTTVGVEVFKKMAKAIVAALEFANYIHRRRMPEDLVHIGDFANIVHIEDESMDLIRDFRFGFAGMRGLFGKKLTNLRQLRKDVSKKFLGH